MVYFFFKVIKNYQYSINLWTSAFGLVRKGNNSYMFYLLQTWFSCSSSSLQVGEKNKIFITINVMTIYWEDIKIQLFTSFFMHIQLLACFFVQYSVVKEKIKEFQLTSIALME